MNTNKELVMPYIKEILEKQKKGQHMAHLFFHIDGDIYMNICGTVFAKPIKGEWESLFKGCLWMIINKKWPEGIKANKSYDKKIEPYMPQLLYAQLIGKYPYIFSFRKNADIFLNVCGVESPNPMPEDEHLACLRKYVSEIYPKRY